MRLFFAALIASDFLAQLTRELAGAMLPTAKQLTAVVREILPA